MSHLHLRTTVNGADFATVRQLLTTAGVFTAEETDVALDLLQETLVRGADVSGYHFCLAEMDGQLAGYACYGQVLLTQGSFDLYWLAVDPAHQRAGVARFLVTEVARLTRQAGGRALYAETSSLPEYAPARAFYERNGFTFLASFPDFYWIGNDKLTFKLPL